MKDEIKSFKIEERVESDHLPMKVEIYGRTEKEMEKEEQWKEKNVWTEEGKRYYQEEIKKKKFEKEKPNELMEEIAKEIKKAILKKTTKIEEKKIRWKKWWDKECTEKRRETRKALRKWKQGKGDKEEYNKKRREYKKTCEEKRDKQQKRIEEEIEQLRNKNDIWKYINRERKKR